MFEFERVATPEDVGVNSQVVMDFLQMLDKYDVQNHSIVIIKDGKIALEKYTAPYSANYAHSMFSTSKSLISTAIGYLIDEGKVTLDTPILDIFPEYAEYKKDKRFERITVKALLTMHSGKKCSFIRHMARGDYAEFFLKSKFKKDVSFVYSNDDVYMLAKAVVKLSGENVVDYLMPRLFEPLGIEKPFWEQTWQNVEAGSTGLYLKSMDLAKICYCYVNHGAYGDKQVIPKEWTDIAGKYYVKVPKYYGLTKDYGYFFWGDPHGGYRTDGMFMQLGIVFPKDNAVVVVTDCSNREKEVTNYVWEYFPKAFREESDGSGAAVLKARIEKDNIFEVPKGKRSDYEKELATKTLHLTKLGLVARGFQIYGHPQSMMPMAIKAAFPRIPWGNFNDFKFSFADDYCTLTWTEDKDVNTVKCGMDGNWREGEITLATYKFKTLSYAYWKDDKTLCLQIRPIETPGYKNLTFTFNGGRFKLYPESNPSFDDWTVGHMDEVDNTPEWISALEHLAVGVLLKCTHPTFGGKIK